jgi:hypothetical protein
MGIGDVDQPMTKDRGRYGDIAAAFQFPNLFAGEEIVSANVLETIDYNLRWRVCSTWEPLFERLARRLHPILSLAKR